MRCNAVLLMDHSASFISAKNKSLKVIVMFIAALMTFLVMTEGFSADAAAAKRFRAPAANAAKPKNSDAALTELIHGGGANQHFCS